MSEKQIRTYLFEKTGLPVPRDGAPPEEWDRWITAAVFIRTRKLAAAETPPVGRREADAAAADFLRRDADAKQFEPFILKALGVRN
jgi:hypothetical protein